MLRGALPAVPDTPAWRPWTGEWGSGDTAARCPDRGPASPPGSAATSRFPCPHLGPLPGTGCPLTSARQFLASELTFAHSSWLRSIFPPTVLGFEAYFRPQFLVSKLTFAHFLASELPPPPNISRLRSFPPPGSSVFGAVTPAPMPVPLLCVPGRSRGSPGGSHVAFYCHLPV